MEDTNKNPQNISAELKNRVNKDEDKKLDNSGLSEEFIRQVKEDRQLDKLLQENLPSHWIKGAEKQSFYDKDGNETRKETYDEWKRRLKLEDILIKKYMRGDKIDHPQLPYIKSRDGELKTNREHLLENKS